MSQSNNKGQDEFRTAVTMTVVWVAGMTLVTIFAALFTGIFLDKILNSKPLFTILLIISSIPVTIYLTFRVIKAANSKIQTQPTLKKERLEEEPHLGKDN